MSNLLDRFRQQLAKEKEQADRSTQGQKEPQDGQAVAYAGILPPDLTSVTKENRGLEERMAKITLVIPELPAEFSDIPDVRPTLASKDDFPDNYWRQKDALVLELMTDNAIITMGRELFGSLSYGVSQYLVGTVFLLAYQLKGPPGKGASPNLLPATDELSNLRDVKLDILDKDVPEATGNMIQPSERGKAEDVAQGYAYLAASMLKMFTKSAENYTKSWQHILSGYKKFYNVVCPISGVTPAEDVIKTIHNHFALSELFKATLYRFLYNINRSGSISSIQKYLYDIHLSHTGIHIVPTVYRICSTMNCSPADLISVDGHVFTNLESCGNHVVHAFTSKEYESRSLTTCDL
ncbi:hypothetical protein FRX31_011848 [Thalictrum thalictroides]|uniref:Uncharacterized protein n=1 Tax=Thalictrum thalictroides TaxID=46969 RepID=A0A7J6WQ19_THATH|nr:hypothetical protein FRX31_011848 [Thalictrum thalictroides]